MDAGAMVSLAEQWTNVPTQRICKSQEINEDRQIDSSYGYTLSVSMDVNGCAGSLNEVRFLEHVQCKVSLNSSLPLSYFVALQLCSSVASRAPTLY